MAITRVYLLARELGVSSTAIMKKCQDEGLDIKNHMTTISAGLAATIREWFSEGEHKTTVETAGKVDLEKVRIKRTRGKKKAAEPPPAVEIPEESAIPAVVQPQTITVVEPVQEAQLASPTHAIVKEAPLEEPKPSPPEPKPEPQPIVPAGPMLEKPAPAKLTGPRVVRVEAPEPVEPRRPRPKPRREMPITQPLMRPKREEESEASLTKEQQPLTKRNKERTHGRRRTEYEAETAKKTRLITQRREKDLEERRARLDAIGSESLRLRPQRKITTKTHTDAGAAVARPTKTAITVPVTVKDLSSALAVKASDIIAKLLQQGLIATANQIISPEVAELVALEFGTELTVEQKPSFENQIRLQFEKRERPNPARRAVVATILGHVDHGKTSLLDKIRSTHVTAGEAGGITQHIGAYQVNVGQGKVTFLDTPGHEAFTAMRARGANMTDVVVLVVAANDGVMPQTIEAIHHAKAANVPVIVALNKIDLPGCDVNRVYAQLAEHGLAPVEWGGTTETVKTSAVTGQGVQDLLEHIDYVSQLLELEADDTIPATGWVVEAKLSQTRGPIATLLIKEGLLKKGDVVLAGCAYGRVKSLKDGFMKSVKSATSSTPVEITGLSAVPNAGDRFYVLDDINKAKAAAVENQMLQREGALAIRTQITLDNLFTQIKAGNVKELNLIIRADVHGSVDVLTKYLMELSTAEVKLKILHAATGGVTEGDVILAEASNAIIIGFNVVADEHVAKLADKKGVEIRFYNIIYRITEDLQKSMVGMLEPVEQEKTLGRAVVRTTFKVSKVGTVAGCFVSDGFVKKNARIRLIRDNIVIRDNLSIESLRHFKDDVNEAKAGTECGIKIARFDDVKTDDVLEFYEIQKVARTLQ
ncbi:MAG: translation initiation factor IF-2 [Sedimentisphaerales bacterium]|nr:translation initiation factor IF-2 [Sedimentisphaerales bacterium]